MTLETRDDRTLFFDMLPLTFKADKEVSLRIKLFTVPGQVIHGSTRRLVLQGADGVAFIADSQLGETDANAASFLDLRDNLKSNGMNLGDMPTVIQFNKRDLPGVRPDNELAELARRGKEPVFAAVATTGQGVLETFVGLLAVTYAALDARHKLADKFGIHGVTLLSEVAEKSGARRSIEALLASSLGGGAAGTVAGGPP